MAVERLKGREIALCITLYLFTFCLAQDLRICRYFPIGSKVSTKVGLQSASVANS